MLAALAAIAVTVPCGARDSGFEGTWVIDKNASMASFNIPEKLTQKIKQNGEELTIQTTWREPKDGMAPLPLLGVMVTELKLKVDGQEERKQVGPFEQVSTTTQNGTEMVTEYTAASEEGKSVSGKWTRSVSPDGKHMTLEITQTGSGQNANGKLTFRRK
jgi:hypothetical protein